MAGLATADESAFIIPAAWLKEALETRVIKESFGE
jgi:hypothetical protein